MPYRRLPKTDQARIQSLKKVIELEQMSLNEIPISFRDRKSVVWERVLRLV